MIRRQNYTSKGKQAEVDPAGDSIWDKEGDNRKSYGDEYNY